MRVCTVGDNTIDVYSGAQTGSFVGGNALNVAVNLRRKRADVTYFGAVGRDDAGKRVLQTLRGLGVSTAGVRMLDEPTASTNVHIDTNGERSFMREEFGASGAYEPTASEIEWIAGFDVVHIGMLTTSAALRNQVQARVGTLSQDCAVTPGYDHLDVAFLSNGPNRDVAAAMAIDAVRDGATLAVVTCGAAGSVAFNGTEWYHVPAQEIQVLDTTGAGDSYAAGFLASYGREHEIRAAMQAGTSAAAETCTHLGAWLK